MRFRGFLGVLQAYWLPIVLIVVAAVVFAGGAIVGVYNTIRAKVPVLPAPKA